LEEMVEVVLVVEVVVVVVVVVVVEVEEGEVWNASNQASFWALLPADTMRRTLMQKPTLGF
jgi:hypothetical protein